MAGRAGGHRWRRLSGPHFLLLHATKYADASEQVFKRVSQLFHTVTDKFSARISYTKLLTNRSVLPCG